jgi:hypothetical protein
LFGIEKFDINITIILPHCWVKIIMAERNSKYSRRMVALFWLAMVAIVIGALIYFQQIALLYVLATIALVALLLIVGFADLENVGVERAE